MFGTLGRTLSDVWLRVCVAFILFMHSIPWHALRRHTIIWQRLSRQYRLCTIRRIPCLVHKAGTYMLYHLITDQHRLVHIFCHHNTDTCAGHRYGTSAGRLVCCWWRKKRHGVQCSANCCLCSNHPKQLEENKNEVNTAFFFQTNTTPRSGIPLSEFVTQR